MITTLELKNVTVFNKARLDFSPGLNVLIGENGIMSVTISSFNGKSKTDAFIEAHKKYIDIQVPLLGIEKIGWKPGDQLMEVSVPYNEAEDLTFYIDRPTAFTKIYPGQFAIYFPEDGHAPGIGQGFIRKAVIKIPVEI